MSKLLRGISLIFLVFVLLLSVVSCKKVAKEAVKFASKNILVAERIALGKDIHINIPATLGVVLDSDISFIPKIEGEFLYSKQSYTGSFVFHPKGNLVADSDYRIEVKSGDKILKEYFKAIEPPKLTAVFPVVDSEAPSNSKITAVFSEPIVPLTTLDEIDESQIPLVMTPKTEGTWKWIGTKTLQFTPKSNLLSSSNYVVSLVNNFETYDGFKLPAFETKFTTTPIRYEYIELDLSQQYDQPIEVRFNQAFDLDKTKEFITLKNTLIDTKVDFVAEYGTKETWDEKTQKYIKEKDESLLAIYQKEDKHERSKLFDFSTTYNVEITKVYPKEGDIVLIETINFNRFVTDVVSNIVAGSDRSMNTNLNFFDPKGWIEIDFYENINIDKSEIVSDKIDKIEYIEDCDPDKDIVYEGEATICDKVPNKSKIKLTFKSDQINSDESFKLTLKKIVNEDGLMMNVDPIVYDLKAIPKFAILKIVQDKSQSASVDNLFICSNSPIKVPNFKPADEKVKADNIDDLLKLNNNYKFKYWNFSYLIIAYDGGTYPECQPNQYQTNINYSLIPHTAYEAELNLKDEFDQAASTKISFVTGDVDKSRLNFYNLQNRYNITSPDKTKMAFAVEAMDYINLEICELSPEDMLKAVNTNSDYSKKMSEFYACKSKIEKRVELPKFYFGMNYFNLDLKDYFEPRFGHFTLNFSHPDYKDYSNINVNEHVFVSITNLSVVQKQVEAYDGNGNDNNLEDDQLKNLKNLYWITDIKTLNPVSNAKIAVYRDNPVANPSFSFAKEYVSNDKGVAETDVTTNAVGVIAYGENGDSAILARNETGLSYGQYASNDKMIYVYSDRPIYRPTDTVNIKGIYRFGYEQRYEFVKDKNVHVSVMDSQYMEVFSKDLKLNDYGTFAFDFILDSGAALGGYNVNVNEMYTYTFDVQEYTPAAFKIDTKLDKEEYIASDTFNLDVQADYYFGVPVKDAKISYSVMTQDYYFDKYQDEYFSFGSGWYDCWYGCNTNDKYVIRGETKLDLNGYAVISKKIDFDKFFKDQKEKKSKIFVLGINIEDATGRQVSTQKSFIVHGGEYYLGIKTDKYFVTENEDFNLKVKSVDTAGQVVAKENIKAVVNKVSYVSYQRKEVDGGFYFRSERKLEPVDNFDVETDSDGNFNTEMSIATEGEYQIDLTGIDSKDNAILSSYTIYVGSADNVSESENLVMPNNDTSLEIVNVNPSLKIGDNASFVIKNPFKKAKALISIERGRIYKYEIVDINGSFYNYEFQIEDDFVPNIYASVTLLSNDPVSVKHGQTNFSVDIETKELIVTAIPDKENYLPGENVKLNVDVKDSDGKAVSSEVSIAVVDMSVLALKGNPHKNPVQFFYNNVPLTISTSANLKNILHEIDVKKGKGGGGGADATKKRGIFKDTACWIAQVTTDANGKGTVEFTLPDNLTTWQIESIAVTQDTKLGVDYKEIMTKKDLFIAALKPRFIVGGDEFSIGAQVFNQTDDTKKVKLSLASETLDIDDDSLSVKLDAKGNQTIYFKVKAPNNNKYDVHKFTLSAKVDDYEDTIESSITVLADTTYETVATASYSDSNEMEFMYIPEDIVKEKGSLKINVSATLANFLSDGLKSIFDSEYDSTETIASKLDAIAIIQKGLNLPNISDKFDISEITIDDKKYPIEEAVKVGLAKIAANQNSDGGFVYYKGWSSDFYLTIRMITTLSHLRDANFEINPDKLSGAINYILETIRYDDQNRFSIADLILASYAVNEAVPDSEAKNTYIKELMTKVDFVKLSSDKYLNEEIDNLSLSLLAQLASQNPSLFDESLKNKAYTVLQNKLKIDARGAHIESAENYNWNYYETSEKNTALFLQSIVIDKQDNQMLGNILRWLINSRSKDGAWGSTDSTLTVIDAFVDYLKWQQENESDFDLQIDMNGEQLDKFSFNKDTILDQKSVNIEPLSELDLGEIIGLNFVKTNNNKLKNNFYYDIALKYYLNSENIIARDEGFVINRWYYNASDFKLTTPITEAKVGDILVGKIEIVVPETRHFVAVENYIPAGMELVNLSLDTESSSFIESLRGSKGENDLSELNSTFYPQIEELRDSKLFMFNDRLDPGVYTYIYYVRALVPGQFTQMPSQVSEMYFPENFGRTSSEKFVVREK